MSDPLLEDKRSDKNTAETGAKCKLIPGPPQVKYIIFNELCERYSYYGMRAILIKYLQERLGFDSDTATSLTMYFGALCYFSPLLGGYIADSYWGKFKTIFRFSIVYCIGGLVMATGAHANFEDDQGASKIFTLVGLILIGIATGGIKPCVSTFGADQFPNSDDREKQMEKYFLAFYFSINVGSIASFLLTPIIREHLGYFYAFLVPAIFLFVALAVFLSASSKYYIKGPEGSVLAIIIGVISTACCNKAAKGTCAEPELLEDTEAIEEEERRKKSSLLTTDARKPSATGLLHLSTGEVSGHRPENAEEQADGKPRFLDRARIKYPQSVIDDVRAVVSLAPIFLCFPCFWALFDQQGNTWEQMAEKMDLGILTPDQMGFWNPVMIMFMIPIFDRFIYPAWSRCQPGVTALHKMAVGMIFAAAAYVVSGFVQKAVDDHPHEVTVMWQLPQYVLITVAEILISITGLEFAYSQAPLSMKAFISAINLAMVGIGDLSAGVIYNVVAKHMTRPNTLFLFAVLMGVNLLVFIFMARRYKFKTYDYSDRKETVVQLEGAETTGLDLKPKGASDGAASTEYHSLLNQASNEGETRISADAEGEANETTKKSV